MTTIEQAARKLVLEITRNDRVGSIHDAVVFQERKRVHGAKRKPEAALRLAKTMAQLKRHPAIEAIADRNQLLDFAFRWIGAKIIYSGERRIHRSVRGERIEIDQRERYAEFDGANYGIGIGRI